MYRLFPKKNKGQATTELAIMGTVVLMLLAYLLQQGFLYNSRQALEMYTFRKALELSRAQERGVALTVSRDLVVPSFFSGLSRQRLTASSSVEVNPWKMYLAEQDDPEDVGSYQLLQINEAMIRDGKFILIPPTKAKMKSDGDQTTWQWINSSVNEINPQNPPKENEQATPITTQSSYAYITSILENNQAKTIAKKLATQDRIEIGISFEDKEKIISDNNINNIDADSHIIDIDESSIPKRIKFILSEQLQRSKTTTTPNNLGGGD